MATVPMSHPATAVKNSDGTWSVRIQHTAEGSVTSVDFTNVLFAEMLAKGYADVLNGKAAAEAKIGQLASDLGPAVADAKADGKKLLDDAAFAAQKLISEAKAEAGKIKADATTLVESAKSEASTLKTEAEKFLAAAKAEAEKLLGAARAEASKILHTAASKVEPTTPPVVVPPVTPTPTVVPVSAAKPTVEEE